MAHLRTEWHVHHLKFSIEPVKLLLLIFLLLAQLVCKLLPLLSTVNCLLVTCIPLGIAGLVLFLAPVMSCLQSAFKRLAANVGRCKLQQQQQQRSGQC